jgi:hypothetical protein
MTKINLAAWAAVTKPFDDRHYCGRDITVADVKAAVQAAVTNAYEAGRHRGRAEVHRDECALCNGQPESCDAGSCLIGAELAGKSPEQLRAIAETQWRRTWAPTPDKGNKP